MESVPGTQWLVCTRYTEAILYQVHEYPNVPGTKTTNQPDPTYN